MDWSFKYFFSTRERRQQGFGGGGGGGGNSECRLRGGRLGQCYYCPGCPGSTGYADGCSPDYICGRMQETGFGQN